MSLRTAVVMFGGLVAVALFSGCIPESNDGGVSTNSITVVNDSDQTIVWLRGTAGLTLDEALDRNVSISAIDPGGTLNRGLGARNADDEYCSPDQQWILAPTDPSVVGPTTLSRGFTSDDFVLIDQREPGFCWGDEPAATWTIG